MSTSDGPGFDELPILTELRDRLNEHYRAGTAAAPKHPRLVRSRRWRPLALIAVLVLGGTTGALAAAGVFESASVSSKYVQPEVLRAINSTVCALRQVPARTTAVPPSSLLSILGVLRRPEAPGGIRDVLSGPDSAFSIYTGLYVRYIRFARSVDGFDWYVSVSAGVRGMSGPANINRCIAAQTANFDRELPRIPKAYRAEATQIFAADVSAERIHDGEKPPIAVNLNGISEYGAAGTGGGAGTAARIESGHDLSYGGFATGSGPDTAPVEGVVPDGVASVTLHYAAGPASAYGHRHAAAANITTRPINNVIVVTVPRNTGNATPQSIIWRAADGRVIKTIAQP